MRPETEGQLAEIVARLSEPVRILGGGTRGVFTSGAELSVTGLNGIELYEPGALTLVTKAGTPVAEVEAALAAEGQRLAFEPMDHRGLLGTSGAPTIGGVVAANVSGPRRVHAGACRDFLLGVRYVDGLGQVIKNGGRVMKNVTGYDLVKLMAGSWGTLGVLTEVSLKVLPMAEAEETLCVAVDGVAQAVAAMSAALGSPFEVSGAAFDPAAGQMLLRVEGFAGSVAYRVEQLRGVVGGFGDVSMAGDSATLWRDVRDVAAFQGAPGDVWRISVKPSDAPDLADRLAADGLLFDWGGGLIWARVSEGTDLRAKLGDVAGHMTLVRGKGQAKLQPEPAPVAVITEQLRRRFDPRGFLNPGLMG
ncbi:FAD-binding protein [Tropicibacter sp. Alg240-R139]|uniref:FAD-binding protein n=1 Tax=Tropicibacter sp. Alg240-R139 TaxID=2305991 RepID=UPI0013DE869D|nr:FAD-binding protein [Tropicibacter sp. Alg240-R139]